MMGIALAASSLLAQEFTTLVSFTNTWRYDQSGQELGTAWRTNDFDDSSWQSGPGVLGYEDSTGVSQYLTTVPSGFGTLFPPPPSQVTTTYYFRTTFLFSGITNSVQLVATNLVDDGCAIWLNGQLAGTLRLPTNGSFNATTFAQGGPSAEGLPEVLNLRGELREGSNQLAVEVHQASATSADVALGMRLIAVRTLPLVITNQPRSLNLMVGDSVTLTVGVSGGPVTYRWQKNGANLQSTKSSLELANVQPSATGDYRVICSNDHFTVTSSVARVTVVPDLAGPRALRAIADNGFGFNAVQVSFSEPLATPPSTVPFEYSVRNPANYRLSRLRNGRTIAVTNVLYSTALGALLMLEGENPDWVLRDDYLLTINNVADRSFNSIPPNSTLPVAWEYVTNLFQDLHTWDFHSSAIFDPGVYDEPWLMPDYVPGAWWGSGWAPFYGVAMPVSTCPSLSLPQTAVGWQPEPMLFRTVFEYPATWPAEATLRVRTAFDDGMVLYLNGSEIYRNNVPGASGTPIDPALRSSARVDAFLCATNISLLLTNLRPGPNCLAAAVVQTSTGLDGDIYFSIEMDARVVLDGVLPPEPLPSLQVSLVDSNRLNLLWNGSGYALESSTNLDSGVLSYPHGPWTEVPRPSNPHLWAITNEPQRFFRLIK
jgi:hypothetical protein